MTNTTKRLLVELAALKPHDGSEADKERFWRALGALQGRADVALRAELPNQHYCEFSSCYRTAAIAGLCSEHAAQVRR